MRIALVSTIRPSPGTSLGMSEYTYQLTKHLKALNKNLKVDNVYAVSEPKRNNILGLLYTNTIFKLRVKGLAKLDYDIVHITDHDRICSKDTEKIG